MRTQSEMLQDIVIKYRAASQPWPATTHAMAQWAIAWCLKDPLVSSVIPGCKDVQQVRVNAEAANLILG